MKQNISHGSDVSRAYRSLFSDFFRNLDDFFEVSWNSQSPLTSMLPPKNAGWIQPKMNLQEDDNSYHFNFEIPGVRKEDLKVDVAGDVLTVTGERCLTAKAVGEENAKAKESESEFFCRSVTLPAGAKAEDLRANYVNGLLEITAPKIEAARRRVIEIQVVEIQAGEGEGLQISSSKQGAAVSSAQPGVQASSSTQATAQTQQQQAAAKKRGASEEQPQASQH
jgi:HSP20 family protein